MNFDVKFEKSQKSIRFLLLLLVIYGAKRNSWKKPGFFIKEKALKSRYGAGSSPGRTTGALPVTSRPKIAMSTLTLIGKIIENESIENENTQQQNNENMKKITAQPKIDIVLRDDIGLEK